jgi:uncharacterized protein YjbI with pentapeptide repeats
MSENAQKIVSLFQAACQQGDLSIFRQAAELAALALSQDERKEYLVFYGVDFQLMRPMGESHVDLSGLDLSDVTFRYCTLQNIDFSNSNLDRVHIEFYYRDERQMAPTARELTNDPDYKGVVVSQTFGSPAFEECIFDSASMRDALIDGDTKGMARGNTLFIEKCSFKRANLQDSVIRSLGLRECVFDDANFSITFEREAVNWNMDLQDRLVGLSKHELRISMCSFRGATVDVDIGEDSDWLMYLKDAKEGVVMGQRRGLSTDRTFSFLGCIFDGATLKALPASQISSFLSCNFGGLNEYSQATLQAWEQARGALANKKWKIYEAADRTTI